VDIYCIGNDGSPHWSDDYFDWPNAVGLVIEWSADCNSDGIVDYGQILAGQLADGNSNGIPDICECATHPELGACRCAGDIVADGAVNGADLGTLLAYWGPRTSGSFSIASDINSDGHIDGSDLGVLLANWGTCTPAGPTVPGWATLIEAFPDPAVVTDPALRMAIAATGLAWRVRDTGTGIEMLLVPPGTFQMGCSQGQPEGCGLNETPVHAATIAQAIYVGRFEVTQTQWAARMGSNPSTFHEGPDAASRPVDSVSWNSVQGFLADSGLRLLTEAEWEYSCRAGTTTTLHGWPSISGGTNDYGLLGDIAWYEDNAGATTHPVGLKAPNGFGLHDMAGNVYEWVNDWFEAPYSAASAGNNPIGPASGAYKVLRSGSWTCDICCRSAFRNYALPTDVYDSIGFRVARNP
jgi:formylglycine-generating enzyme required for sulfatase activity